MTVPSTALLRLVAWVACSLGFNLDLQEDSIIDSLDEREIVEQLQYGRD